MIKKNLKFGLALWVVCIVTPVVVANEIEQVRWGDGPNYLRIVLDMQEDAEFHWAMLDNPTRFYIDLEDTSYRPSLQLPNIDNAAIGEFRFGMRPNNETRLVLELSQAKEPKVLKLGPSGDRGYRVVIDVLKDVEPRDCSTEPSTDVVVVVDAGHGGEDPGAIAINRVYEKSVTLAISKFIKAELEKNAGFRVVLTRDGDYELPLKRRRRIAEQHRAHLFVSIHADAFRNSRPKGASVFVLADGKAKTELSRWLEANENRSDWQGGVVDWVNVECFENPDDLLILNSLSQQEALAEAVSIGSRTLASIDKVATLHPKSYDRKTSQYVLSDAGFEVLKSLAVPSLLIETGFLSNPDEARKLSTRSYQTSLANAIAGEIKRYFCENPPWHTDLEKGIVECTEPVTTEYHVKRGDTLSEIASSYRVTIAAIRVANGLSTDTIRVGQRLIIPLGN